MNRPHTLQDSVILKLFPSACPASQRQVCLTHCCVTRAYVHQDTHQHLGHLGYGCAAPWCPSRCTDCCASQILRDSPHDPSLIWDKPLGPCQNLMPPTVSIAEWILSLALSFPHLGLHTGLLPCHPIRHSTTPFTNQLGPR